MVGSLGGVVEGAVLVDTGSTDGTVAEFERACMDTGIIGAMQSKLFNEPGQPFPFALARNYALSAAREIFPAATHILFLDCDETLEVDDPSVFELEGDLFCCHMLSQGGQTRGMDCLMIRADLEGEFTPITHEAFTPKGEYREVFLPGVRIVSHDDSARRGSGNKSRHDVELLEPWCREHPDDHRAQYYLAQSLWNVAKESDDREGLIRALLAFEKRILMGGHPEESWFSMYMRAACLEKLEQSRPIVLDAYLTAYNADPSRVEPLCALWSYLFERREETRDWALMRMLASEMVGKPEPTRGMYVDVKAYKWCAAYMLGLSRMGLGDWKGAAGGLRNVFPLLPEDEKIVARQAIVICQEKTTG